MNCPTPSRRALTVRGENGDYLVPLDTIRLRRCLADGMLDEQRIVLDDRQSAKHLAWQLFLLALDDSLRHDERSPIHGLACALMRRHAIRAQPYAKRH